MGRHFVNHEFGTFLRVIIFEHLDWWRICVEITFAIQDMRHAREEGTLLTIKSRRGTCS